MGWKTLKEAFGIQHIVCVTEQGICIGSCYVTDIATINIETGKITDSEVFPGFIRRTYRELQNTTPADLLALIQAEDTFSASIKVYTYQDGDIIEKLCEVPGYPNATHDGELMYQNTFSTDRNTVIGWAKRDARLRVNARLDYCTRLRQQLAEAERELLAEQGFAEKLQVDHPDVPAGAD